MSGMMMTNNFAIEVESNAVADLTGRLGTAVVTYRGHDGPHPHGWWPGDHDGRPSVWHGDFA